MKKDDETVKVRIVEIEGKLSDLAKVPAVADVLRLSGDGETARLEESLPPSIQDFIEREAPPASRTLLLRFAREISSWEGVTAAIGGSVGAAHKGAYVRFSRRPQYVGAFAYLVPSRLAVRLRLPSKKKADSKHAVSREVRPQDPYQLAVSLSKESIDEAIQLARQAYETAAAPSDRTGGGR
jgi:hypothetical protein